MAMKQNGFIVALDGPSGAGKSTVARRLADLLSGSLLDTGGMYRAVAYHALKEKAQTAAEFGAIARKLSFDQKGRKLLVNGKSLGKKLRTPKVTEMASFISQFKSVRKVLTSRQRELGKAIAKEIPVVVEGRDIGTVVFPRIKNKFYVTAKSEIRAKRRLEQLRRQGHKGKLSLKDILDAQEKRDYQDSHRKRAPLKKARNAIEVDTSEMDIDQVVQFIKRRL